MHVRKITSCLHFDCNDVSIAIPTFCHRFADDDVGVWCEFYRHAPSSRIENLHHPGRLSHNPLLHDVLDLIEDPDNAKRTFLDIGSASQLWAKR